MRGSTNKTLTRPKTRLILDYVKRNLDKFYASQKIFQDYVNKRETIRRVIEKPNLTLTRNQEKALVTKAREHFRLREMQDFKYWLCRFFFETGLYFKTIQIKAWPMMRTPK